MRRFTFLSDIGSLGSHKTRDKRCSIAAPLLESVLTSTLTTHGYTVDNTGAALHDVSAADRAEGKTEEELEARLKTTTGESKEVGIFKISHLGGHRYSGVMIVSRRFSVPPFFDDTNPRSTTPDLLSLRRYPLLRPRYAQTLRCHRREDHLEGQDPAGTPQGRSQPSARAEGGNAAGLVKIAYAFVAVAVIVSL